MEELKFDYKDDLFTGLRKYNKIDNADGTISLEDVTTYEQTGDIYSASDMNTTNRAVNEFHAEYTAKINEVQIEYTTKFDEVTRLTTLLLPAVNWGTAAPFIQTIPVSGMKNTDIPIPGVIYPVNMTEVQKAQIDKSVAMIDYITTNNGSVTVKCSFKKPTTDLTISLKGV